MYCYCTGEVHWQQGNIIKKVNNVLLLLLLKQNLQFVFGLLELPFYTRNVITLQPNIIRTQKWKRWLCKPLKEKHSVFSEPCLLSSSGTGISFLLSKMLKIEIQIKQSSAGIYIIYIYIYILTSLTPQLTTWCIPQPIPSTFHPPKPNSQINKVKQSCSCANH